MRDEILWRTLYDQNCTELYDIAEKVKSEGTGATQYWTEIATSASAGSEPAKAKIEELLGRKIESLNDIYDVTRVCRALSSLPDLVEDAHIAKMLVGTDASHSADQYLANHIAEIRRLKGMTQKELSKKSGIPLVTLQKLEHYPERALGAQYNTILRLAKALDVTTEELVNVIA